MSFVVKATIIGSSDAYTPVCYGLSSDISKITFKINGTSVDIIDVPDDEQYSWFSLELTQGETVTVEVSGSSEDLITFEKNNYLQSAIIQSATIIPEGWMAACNALQSISIPEGVTSIGEEAFAECPILSGEIIIPDSVTSTGDSVFSRCPGITSVTLGSGLTNIAYYMFNGCTGLTNIIIPDNVETIGTYSFQDCESLTDIDIPGNVYFIGEGAFSRCTSLTNVVIPDSVQTGYEYIFDGCTNLTSVTIGSEMRSIGYGIFRDCSNLSSVTVSSDNPYYDSRGNCNAIIETSSNTLIAGCKNTVIPDDITTIGMMAFGGQSGITSVTIPDSVITIEDYAFDACSNMTNLTIGSGLTSIGEDAFRDCTSLESIVVSPNNTIYDSREGCNCIIETATNELLVGSNNAFIPNSIISIGKEAFKYCPNLTGELVIPNGVTTIDYEAFFGCSNLTGLTIPNSVTKIGVRAFYQCSGLTGELVIPDSVTELGGSSFDECTGLTSVVTGSGITTITGFNGCTGLTNVTIGPNVTTIDLFAFANCTGLTSIVIPDSVQTIGQSAFLGCTGLSEVTIGSGVTTIKPYAFSRCTSLNTIRSYATTAPSLDATTFNNIKSNGTLYYPTGSTYSTWLRTAPYYLGYYGWDSKPSVFSTLEVPVGGGTYEFEYPDGTYTVSSIPSWIESVSISGNTNVKITIEVNPNISSSIKSGDIVIQGPNNQFIITVTQEALSVEWRQQPYIFANNAGGTYTNSIDYNLKPDSIVYSIPFADWVRVTDFSLGNTYSDSTIEIEAAGGDVARNAAISAELHYGDQTYIVTNDILQYSKNYTVSPSGTIEVPAEGGQAVITIESDYTLSNYTSVDASYGTVVFERLSDTKIQITIILERNDDNPISMVPVLKTDNVGLKDISLVTITQSKLDLVWDFPTDPIHLEAEKSTFELAFTSNVEISNITISNAPTWIIFTRDGDKYVGVAVQNKSDERSATVTFTADDWGVSKTVNISQDGLYWEFATDSVHIGVEASTFDLPYTSNIEIKSFIVYDKPNWLTLKRGDSKYIITATRNTGESRTATVTFNIYGSATSRKVVFTQDGFEWVLDANSIEFNSTNSTPDNPAANPLTESISFTSTLPITELEATIQYLSGSDWLSVDYNGDIIVTALDNRLGTYREAVITLYSTEYDLSRQIAVTQLGSSFTWDASTIDVSSSGGVATFNYTGSNGFLLLSDISVENAELAWSFNGGYNGSISFTVPINTGIARIFNPKVYAGDRLLTTFTINQADPDITVDTPEIIVPAEGIKAIVYIESAIPWYVEIVGDWISVNPSSGSGDAGITVTVGENPLTDVRIGYIYIRNGVDREVIKVSQVGSEPYLYFTKKYMPLPLAGGVRYVKLVNNTHWTTIWEIQ